MRIEEKRAEILARRPWFYSGRLHLLWSHVFGFGGIAACAWALERLSWWEAALVPAFFAFANLVEWGIHRGPMHRPTRGLRVFYERHAREHHVLFTDARMGLGAWSELQHVLFPPLAMPFFLVMSSPVPIALGLLVSADLALLFVASALAYYLVYEWFHLVHHLPADCWLARRAVVARVRRHHQLHHAPALQTRGNFNVSFPLWDVLLGTRLPDTAADAAVAAPPPSARVLAASR